MGDQRQGHARRLIRRAPASLLALLAACAGAPDASVRASGPVLELAGRAEPGRRLTVTGVVRDTSGLPLPNMTVGFYQADAAGSYGAASDPALAARLSGWLVTDSLGRYRLETVAPGSHHIHAVVRAPSGARAMEIGFYSDSVLGPPRLDAPRGPPASLDSPVHVVRDLRLGGSVVPDLSRIATWQELARDSARWGGPMPR